MEYIIISVTVIFFALIIWYIVSLNKINRLIVKIEEADSGIDVALTKRYDVLTKMVDVVKAYTKHETETFAKVINLRNGMAINEKIKLNDEVTQSFDSIRAIVENYHELKSSENYKKLQNAIIDVEEHLQAARRLYNANISLYNQIIATFPNNLVAKLKSMKKKDFFETEDTKQADINIKI